MTFLGYPKKMLVNNKFFSEDFHLKKSNLSFTLPRFKKLQALSNPLLISLVESLKLDNTLFYGKFYLGPFGIGQGLTIVNALRRTLLSELTTLAITSVEIEGVTHEYSTISGVKDSVLDILSFLKKIVLKSSESLKKPQIAYINFQGPGIIKAKHIRFTNMIKCVDPEQYIATVSEDGIVNMKLVIKQGTGYVNYIHKKEFYKTSEQKKGEKVEKRNLLLNSRNKKLINNLSKNNHIISTTNSLNKEFNNIEADKKTGLANTFVKKLTPTKFGAKAPFIRHGLYPAEGRGKGPTLEGTKPKSNSLKIDAVFMPIHKVNYLLELDDRGSSSPRELVVLEIWTDGSLMPTKALKLAINRLLFFLISFKKARMIRKF